MAMYRRVVDILGAPRVLGELRDLPLLLLHVEHPAGGGAVVGDVRNPLAGGGLLVKRVHLARDPLQVAHQSIGEGVACYSHGIRG